MKVRDAMTRDVFVVTPDTPLKQVAEMLIARRVSGLPVVDDGAVLGVISEADFVTKEAAAGSRPSSWVSALLQQGADRRHREAVIGARLTRQAMSAPAVTISPDQPLSEAAHRMARGKINRLPVVERNRLVGIITRADIVRAYARTDEDLYRAASDALRAVDGLRVKTVTNGVVVLSGTVQSESLAETVRRIVQHIDGVVAVDDENVSWVPGEVPI